MCPEVPGFTAENALQSARTQYRSPSNRLGSHHASGAVPQQILSFTDRATDVVEKQFLRVDVTEEFPFLATRLSRTRPVRRHEAA
jgi:hypothetical protein